jgi:hypothetical protein
MQTTAVAGAKGKTYHLFPLSNHPYPPIPTSLFAYRALILYPEDGGSKLLRNFSTCTYVHDVTPHYFFQWLDSPLGA